MEETAGSGGGVAVLRPGLGCCTVTILLGVGGVLGLPAGLPADEADFGLVTVGIGAFRGSQGPFAVAFG